jgi:hypothetical protein
MLLWSWHVSHGRTVLKVASNTAAEKFVVFGIENDSRHDIKLRMERPALLAFQNILFTYIMQTIDAMPRP